MHEGPERTNRSGPRVPQGADAPYCVTESLRTRVPCGAWRRMK
jgi:hypothetical protein